MKNKHWLIAAKISCITLIPLIAIFGFIPMGYYLTIDHKIYLKEIVEPLLLGKWNNVFMFYCFIVGLLGTSIIFTTIINIIKDSDDLDNLDEAIDRYNKARMRLERKIKENYNEK